MAETTVDLVVCPVDNDSSQRPKPAKPPPRSSLIKPRGLKQIFQLDKEWEVIEAAVAGDLDRLISLKNEGIDINVFTPLGETPVHCACRNGNLDCVQWLLANSSIPPDFGDIDGETAIHAATKWGNIGCLHWLLNNTSISPDHRSWGGNNIMHLAVYREKTELIKMILRCDLICADALNNEGLTVWDTAVKLNRNDIAELLIAEHWFMLINDCFQKVLFTTLRALIVPRGEIVRRNDDNTSWCLVLNPSIEVFCQQRDLKIMSSRIASFLAAFSDPALRLDLFMNKKDILNKALELTVHDQATVLVDNDTNIATTSVKAVIRYIGQLPGKIGSYFGIELSGETQLGNTDGTYNSEVMFSCPSGSGLFVTIDKVFLTAIDEKVMSEYEKQCADGKSTSRSCKITLVGPPRAGKTSCIRTLLDKPFNSREPSTVGASLNSQAIVSLLRSWPQEHELEKGIQLDTYTALNWKEADIKDLLVLLDKEYKTEMYERLQKCIISHCRSRMPSRAGSPTDSEDFFECCTSLTGLDQLAASIRSENIPADVSNPPASSGTNYSVDKKELFDCVKEILLGDRTDKLAIKLSFSDFAGQLRFFHFQLLFLKRQDVIVLTINAAMNPHGPLVSPSQEGNSRDQSRSGMMTPIQAFHCWLQTVSAHSGTSDVPVGSLSRRSPTVITCFTHAEHLCDREQQSIIQTYRDSLHGKDYGAHLPDEDKVAFHMISNKNRKRFDKSIRDLKQTLVKAAKPVMNELRPIKYLKLEELIAEKVKENVNTLSLLEFTQLANQAGIQGDASSPAILASLDYCTKRGNILYFSEIVSLNDIVFISPQWLCCLISHVIKAHDLRPKEACLQCAWKRYDQHGILEERFLDFILRDAGIFHHKEIILVLTMHFYLLSEIIPNIKLVEESMTPSPEGRVFIVPALLKSSPRQHEYKPGDFDQALSFCFPDGYFPEPIMNHILTKTINWSVSEGYSIHEVSHGFGKFGLGRYQYYRLVYDFSNFCLKLYIGQLDICRRKSKEYYPVIVDDFMRLLQHLKQSITEVMDIFIPKATKPLLYVICPFCIDKENVTPHVRFDFNAPVLCCELCDVPQELARSCYIPCGIDLEDMKKSASSAAIADISHSIVTHTPSTGGVSSAVINEYRVFTAFHSRLSAVLSISATKLSPHLVAARILSVDEERELDSISNANKKAAFVLKKITEDLKTGSTQIFYFLMFVIENHGDISSIQLVSEIKREIVSCTDGTSKEYEIFIHYYGKLASTLPVTGLCPHLVTEKVITPSEVIDIQSLPTNIERAMNILRRISASLEIGQTKTFYLFLSAIEAVGIVHSSQVVSDMKQEIKSATGYTFKASSLEMNPRDGVVFTVAPQRNDLVEHVCSPIATKCYLVGKHLGLHKDVLDKIKKKCQGNDLEASYEIITHWLYEGTDQTWMNLIAVLASDEVGEYTLAQLLSEKFVPGSK